MKSLPKQRKCITIRVLILTVVIALLFWIGSLIKCEVLTNRYEIEFQELYKDNTMLNGIDSLKVLGYASDTTRIYYVANNRSSGNILVFNKENDRWSCTSWETVWSKSGSADGFVWPYIR